MSNDPLSAWQDRHRRLAELTAAPDARVPDLGCGEGTTLQELTGRVGPGGWLLGIDRNPRALTVAATAMPPDAPRWLLLCGDLAQPLPIATGSVDRVLCHNTLEALANPTGLLVEAHRVLRPGGGAVIGHSDFDTLVFAGTDLALTRRLVHTYCDQRQPGWMDAVDGTIGRRLPALVSRSPLQVRQVHAQVLLEQAFAPWALGFMLAKGRSPWPPSPAGSPRRSWIPGWPACRSPRPRRLPVQHQRLHRGGHQRAPECHPRGELIDIAAS